MACRTNQLGSIVSTSRETLNEGKVVNSPMRKVFAIGSLRSSNLPTFQAPVAGLPMVHWNER